MNLGKSIIILWVVSTIFLALLLAFRTKPSVTALQKAWSYERAKVVIEVWRTEGVLAKARRNLTVDYGYVFTFYPWLALVCIWLSRQNGWEKAGATFAWLALLAGLSDLVEDLAMEVVWSHVLSAQQTAAAERAAKIAASCSYSKFGLAATAGLFVVVSGVRWLFLRQNGV